MVNSKLDIQIMKGSVTITKALKVDKVVTVKATIFKYILLKWYI